MSLSIEAADKALVLKALSELNLDPDFSVFDRYFTDRLLQHNPRLPDGTDALRALLRGPRHPPPSLERAAAGRPWRRVQPVSST